MTIPNANLPGRIRIENGYVAKSVSGVPALWFARAIESGLTDSLAEPYRESAWVRRAIKHVAGPIAGVDLVFMNPGLHRGSRRRGCRRLYTARGLVHREDEAEVDLPQVRQFLRSPMRGLTYEDFVEASIGWLKLSECFWVLDDRAIKPFPEVNTKPFPQIIVARPDRMRHIAEGGEIKAWEFRDGQGRAWTLPPEQVVRLFGWNPYNDFRGLGDYPAAATAADGDWLAGRFSRNLMSNNGDTGPFIIAKNGVPTDPQREQILADLKAKRQAQLNGNFRPVFLTGDISIEDPQIRSVDAAFVAGRIENRHEIFIAFGVPPSLADVKAAYSIGSASDFFQLILNTCIPEGKKFCAALEVLIERLTGQRVEVGLDWDEHPVMQQVRSERLKEMDGLWGKGMPMVEVSEYLRLGLPRFKGDDIGYLPFSVAPAASVAAGAMNPETDGDFAEPAETNDQPPDEVEEMKAALVSRRSSAGLLQRGRSAREIALWNSHAAKRRPVIAAFKSKFNRELMKARGEVLAKLEKAKSLDDLVSRAGAAADFMFDLGNFRAGLLSSMRRQAALSLDIAGQQLFTELGKDDPFTMPAPEAMAYLKNRENKLTDTPQEIYDRIKGVLEQGLNEGDSIQSITDALRAEFNGMSRDTATRIAMTETAAVYGKGRDEAMKQAGVQYKQWLTSGNANVRPAHAAANGQTVPVDETFTVGGEHLMHPGDEHGSAGNVINCHCVSIAVAAPEENT